MTRGNRPVITLLTAGLLLVAGCSHMGEPVPESRFVEPDRLFQTLEANVRSQSRFEFIADIDHARLAAKAGAPMPPSHLLIWSDPELEAALLKHNPLAAIDLPLRALAFEDQDTRKAMVIANSYDYVANRHLLPDDETTRAQYETGVATALKGIPEGSIARFASHRMPDPGLVTLSSPHNFAATEKRILGAIDAQSDTMIFAIVDFTSRSKKYGVTLEPTRLMLFGAPGPGGEAMKSAPTLGLDVFCQKLLIWQDSGGNVHVTFNDLLALAERLEVSGGIPLRVINRRLRKTFSEALQP